MRTLRRWDKEGRLGPIARSGGGHRWRFGWRLRERLGVVRSALSAEAGRRTDEAQRLAKTGSPEEGRARTIAVGCERIGTVGSAENP